MRVRPRALVRQQRILAVALTVVLAMAIAVVFGPWEALAAPVLGSGYYLWTLRKVRRRQRIVEKPFPHAWRSILQERCDFYGRLDDAGREHFEQDVQIFLAEQRIFGLRGETVSEPIRVLIAASAATLSFGLPDWEWSSTRDIVVYPAAFNDRYDMEDDPDLSGMVHRQGPVLLSKPSLQLGFARGSDGHNVALHEFAHVMDFADGYADGVPEGVEWHATAPWVETVADRLRQVRSEGHPALRRYAGVDEAELFAVAVEVFFERPERLQEKDPELYDLLHGFFGVDPRRPRLG